MAAAVELHTAHSSLPSVGYPHAAQIATEFSPEEAVTATAVPFARCGACTPSSEHSRHPHAKDSPRRGAGTDADMNSDTILALSGLICLATAALTGALWDTPVVTTPFRWLLS